MLLCVRALAQMNDCMDPEELAILKEEGGQRSGNQLRVVNAIADAVADDYPVLIDTFAYEQTAHVPAVTKPAPNVIIRTHLRLISHCIDNFSN